MSTLTFQRTMGIDVSLGSMGWVTAEKVRASVACPKCKAKIGIACADLKHRHGVVNHRERQVAYRRALSSKMQILATR